MITVEEIAKKMKQIWDRHIDTSEDALCFKGKFAHSNRGYLLERVWGLEAEVHRLKNPQYEESCNLINRAAELIRPDVNLAAENKRLKEETSRLKIQKSVKGGDA